MAPKHKSLCAYRIPKGARTIRADDVVFAASLLRATTPKAAAEKEEEGEKGAARHPLIFTGIKARFLVEDGKTVLQITGHAKAALMQDTQDLLDDVRARLQTLYADKGDAPLTHQEVAEELGRDTGETSHGTRAWRFVPDTSAIASSRKRATGDEAAKRLGDKPDPAAPAEGSTTAPKRKRSRPKAKEEEKAAETA
jgi:hypothetical protein